MKNTPHNIYFHVPFCKSKCNYCAFLSWACATPDWDKYCDDICDEILYWANKMPNTDVPTVFFGGGTPSLMPAWCFEKIMQTLYNNFQVAHNAEITIEANPGTIDKNKLNDFISSGVNRISVGVQSLDDDKLRFLGRRHSADDAICLIRHAQNAKIRLSADFIYGLPGENVTDTIKTVEQINNLGLQHCSLYELTIEKNTPFGKMNLKMPDNETMAQMYNAIAENLTLKRYEVSNYATPGNECRHNLNIWDGGAYIGIGQGGAGRIHIDNVWYEQMGNYQHFSPIDDDTRAVEKILMGIRTVSGCQLTDDVKKVIYTDWVQAHPELVQIKDNRISATPQGMLILDDVVLKMVK
ncbi:MAG: radical SAM family heme chaperone HemW [Alphaproteobacteria bacterium]|nr:radical SAM family heme chaperone HemW [Alphaproteobacteria bacterium]